VLDPSIITSPFPAAGGLSDGGLRTLLTEVADACELAISGPSAWGLSIWASASRSTFETGIPTGTTTRPRSPARSFEV
jgi:hypothetical protein